MKKRKQTNKNISYLILLTGVLLIAGILYTKGFFQSALWWPFFLGIVIIGSIFRIISRARK